MISEASDGGSTDAKYMLATCYKSKDGDPGNLDTARKLYWDACIEYRGGHKKAAMPQRNRLASSMRAAIRGISCAHEHVEEMNGKRIPCTESPLMLDRELNGIKVEQGWIFD